MKRGPMGMHGGHGPAEKAKDFKIHPQSAAFFLWFFHSRSYRFTIYSGLLYPVDVYPNYPTNHSWRRYKVETLLDT